MLNRNLNQSNQSNQNEMKEDKAMRRIEEIRTEIEELINEIKDEEKELKYFDGELIYKKDNKIYKNYDMEYIEDIIREWVDGYFIYYSDADDFLKDYDTYEEIHNYSNEFGTIPEDQCQLAAYVLEYQTLDSDYSIIEDIQDKLGTIEELQEELEEIEEEPVEEVER